MSRGSSNLTSWVQAQGTEVSQSEWSANSTTSTDTTSQCGGGGRSSQLTLYELNQS